MAMIRDKSIKIRAFENERLDWQAKASNANMTLANYIRSLLNSEQVKRDAPIKRSRRSYEPVDPVLIRQLAKIGNNLNQIAKRVNSDDQSINIISELLIIQRQLEVIKNAH
jgi:uncharacterized protein YukE